MSKSVLDASALLAFLNQERGQEHVAKAILDGSTMSTVNLSEVVAKLCDAGVPVDSIHEMLDLLGLEIVDFDIEFAYQAGLLRPSTKQAGLSLGDRVCLALGHHLNLPVLTTDRIWQDLQLGILIQVIR